MKLNLKTFAIITLSFLLGFKLNATINSINSEEPRVTSIGGIFFKCKNPQEVRNWYRENLGLKVNEYGAVFEWRQASDSSQKGFCQWSPFNEKTKYFDPSTKDFMINYRVSHLEKLIQKLKTNNVTVLDTIESYDYGKFVHILDSEGNKIELWEPNDVEFAKLGESMKAETNK